MARMLRYLMFMRIRSYRDVCFYTGIITLSATFLSELAVLALYLSGGTGAFHMQNAIIFAGIVPVLISAPITFTVMRMSLRLAATQAELRRLAHTDPLTNLPNRRSFFRAADEQLRMAGDDGIPAALLVIDADHFKELNDSYGHAVGDTALCAIADALRSSFRQNDLVCRVGGEEFAVLLPGLDANAAAPLAQRLVDSVANSPLQADASIIEYTVSCGIADTRTSYDLPTLFKAADDAMYQAKRQGRARVVTLNLAA